MKQAFSFDRGRVASPLVLSPLYFVGKWDMPRNNGPPNQSLCFAILIKCHEQTEIIIYHINRLKNSTSGGRQSDGVGPITSAFGHQELHSISQEHYHSSEPIKKFQFG